MGLKRRRTEISLSYEGRGYFLFFRGFYLDKDRFSRKKVTGVLVDRLEDVSKNLKKILMIYPRGSCEFDCQHSNVEDKERFIVEKLISQYNKGYI